MRKIIVEAEVSLDGVICGENPDFWAQFFNYHGEYVLGYLKHLLFAPDALLMGRKTYELFAQVWPSRNGEEADRINSMPKYVASRGLKEPLAWNATLMEGDVAKEIGKLKEQPGRDLLQYGVGELTRTMLQHRHVDEVRLVVFRGRPERAEEVSIRPTTQKARRRNEENHLHLRRSTTSCRGRA